MEHGQDHVFCRERLLALRSEDRHAEALQDEVGIKQAPEDLKEEKENVETRQRRVNTQQTSAKVDFWTLKRARAFSRPWLEVICLEMKEKSPPAK